MNDRPVVDQQLVVHLFAPTDGPQAQEAYRALRALWLGCRQLFLMPDPIPGAGLPHQLPVDYRDFPGTAETGAEAALAAQERADADCQAILRRHHDVLNLSLVLAPPQTMSAPATGHSWWQDLDSQWSFISDRLTGGLLGEARIYLAESAAPPGPLLDQLLPPTARIEYWQPRRAAADGLLALWEAPPWVDSRATRRLVLTFRDGDDDKRSASAWAWSDGGPAIPLLARYLLHAARLRYEYRVWQRDAGTHQLIASIREDVARTRRLDGAGRDDDPDAAQRLRERAHETRLLMADLRELRRAAEVAAHNMRLAIQPPSLLAPAGPLADDRDLATSFLERVDDELWYLDVAAERAADGSAAARSRRAPAAPKPRVTRAVAEQGASVDVSISGIEKNVFVAYGRDDQAAGALFGFLQALGLHPLDWETLVAATGNTAPYLRDVIMQGIAMAQAAVVLLTPDDVVQLHPDLGLADDDEHEGRPAMQARPNVILELGMALATYADRTVVLVAGRHRPMADLGGLNYIRLTPDEGCLGKIVRRLRTARCAVGNNRPDPDARAWFASLAAYHRNPPDSGLRPGVQVGRPQGRVAPVAVALSPHGPVQREGGALRVDPAVGHRQPGVELGRHVPGDQVVGGPEGSDHVLCPCQQERRGEVNGLVHQFRGRADGG
jgi:predicted nucleotide-binding protein